MTDRKATLTAVLVDAVSGTAKKIQAEITGIGHSVTAVGSILQGVGQSIGQGIARIMSDVVGGIARAIPDLLDQGHAYIDQLHQIQLETGMTAEQTSALVGAFREMGVPIDSIQQLFARLSVNLASNEDRFRELGIATRDNNGNMLDAYTIFQNLRRAVQEHGSSLLSTAAIQELFGRSGYKIVEALQASDAEWQVATENVRRWGGIVSQATIAASDRLGDTLASFWQGVTDIGVNIAAAVDPYLRSFVDAFANFVQSHLAEIVNFAVNVVNTVIGFISGLFGITDALAGASTEVASSTKKASAGTDDWGKKLATAKTGSDAFTTSLQNQIKAIDRNIAAIESAAQRRRATQERAKLADSLAAARAQLADLRGSSPFLGGLSAAEQALAIQKHAQDVIDAEKNVQDQRKALGDFEADQKDRAETELLQRQKQRLSERLAAAKLADQEMLQSGLRMGQGLDTGIGTSLSNIGINAQKMGAQAAGAFKSGFDAAKGFLNILLGTEEFHRTSAAGSGYTTRVGGIVGAIGAVGSILKTVGDAFGFLGDVLRIFIDTLGVMATRIMRMLTGIYQWFTSILGKLAELGGGPKGGGAFAPGGFFNPGPNNAQGGFYQARPGGHGITVAEAGEDEWVIPASKMGGFGGPTVNLYFDFISMPSDDQIRTLTEKVSARLAFAMAHTPSSSGAF